MGHLGKTNQPFWLKLGHFGRKFSMRVIWVENDGFGSKIQKWVVYFENGSFTSKSLKRFIYVEKSENRPFQLKLGHFSRKIQKWVIQVENVAFRSKNSKKGPLCQNVSYRSKIRKRVIYGEKSINLSFWLKLGNFGRKNKKRVIQVNN